MCQLSDNVSRRSKSPKALFTFPEGKISQVNVTQICLQIQPKLQKLKAACMSNTIHFSLHVAAVIKLHKSFLEPAAVSNFIRFLEYHAEKIHTLDISHNPLGMSFTPVSDLKDLNAIDALHYFLGHTNCQLRKLICVNCSLRDSQIEQIADVLRIIALTHPQILKINKTVKKINMVDNNWTDEVLLTLYAAFYQNKALPLQCIKLCEFFKRDYLFFRQEQGCT